MNIDRFAIVAFQRLSPAAILHHYFVTTVLPQKCQSGGRIFVMRALRAPSFLVGVRIDIREALQQRAVETGLNNRAIDDILQLLPAPLVESPCFFNRLTREWCYDFGLPVDRLPGDQSAIGSPTFPSVRRLFELLQFASGRIAADERRRYLRRLEDESRHQDVMAEMLVALGFPTDASLGFEVDAETGNSRTIDWRITRSSHPPILLDVKNRMGDAAAFLANLVNQLSIAPCLFED